MIASPLLQQVWSSALHLGGRWLVLPFLVLMVLLIPRISRFEPLTSAAGNFHGRFLDVLPAQREASPAGG
jgi:hypothetical protein